MKTNASLAIDDSARGDSLRAESAAAELAADTLSPQYELRVLKELENLSAQRALLAAQIKRDHDTTRKSVDLAFSTARTTLHAQTQADLAKADSDYEALQACMTGEFDERFQSLADEYDRVRTRALHLYETGKEQAHTARDEACWQADTVYEAGKDEPGKQQAEIQLQLDTWLEQIHATRDAAKKLLLRWRQRTVSELTLEPDEATRQAVNDEHAQALAQFRQCLEIAEAHLLALRQLHAPRLFEGISPYLAALGSGILLVVPLLLWVGPHGLWISFLAAAGIDLAVGAPMFQVAKAQTARIYAPLVQAVANAQLWRARCMNDAQRQLERRRAKITARHEDSLARARELYRVRRKQFKKDRDEQLRECDAKYPPRIQEIGERREVELRRIAEQHVARRKDIEQRFRVAWQAAQDQFAREDAALREEHASSEQALADAWVSGVERLRAMVDTVNRPSGRLFPGWAELVSQPPPQVQTAPASIRFGAFQVESADFSGKTNGDASLSFALPALLPLSQGGSLLIKARGKGRGAAVSLLQAVMLRLLTSLPPGKAKFTIIDPVGLGENFAAFMHLVDYDESLVNNRIWTEPRHIEQRLADLSEHMENVIQKYLRNEFETIQDYNADAGEVAEPFRFLVIANFPANFSEAAVRRLMSIAGSGARCGVYTLIAVDGQEGIPGSIPLHDLEEHSVTLNWENDHFVWRNAEFGRFPLTVDTPPAAQDFTKLLQAVGQSAKQAGRVEVPFEFIAPTADRRWTWASDQGVDVPLGRAGATRLQHMKLGQGTSQHVVVAGKTGSGKSTLLHALITNIALRYSPDEVELYLIDFKKGVEFKPYATFELPHARVVAIESDREFGLSVLERLDVELKARADRFRDLGVQDLAGFRRVSGQPLPRILLIVDEFQEFFVEDDKTSQGAALLLDRLVRQGRAFGIHIMLGSQTLAGAYSLARSTIGQMAVRVALQCSEADSHLILSEENTAARLLSRPGEAIYNDMNGLIEGNHFFQVVWLSDQRREEYLRDLQTMARETGIGASRPRMIFEGNVPADPERNLLLDGVLRGGPAPFPQGAAAWLGEAVAIKDPTAAVFRRQSGSNLLIVGQNHEAALAMLVTSAVGLAAQAARGGPGPAKFIVLDGSQIDSEEGRRLARLRDLDPASIQLANWRELPVAIDQLAAEVERRLQPGQTEAPPIYVLIYGLQSLRDLRKAEDDFSYSRGGEDRPPNPAKQFASIVRDGSQVGVHALAWCDSLNSLNRMWERQTLREFEMRVVFQMSAADSSTLIDTPTATNLGLHRALFYSEETGRAEKFRPYRLPSDEWLKASAERGVRNESSAEFGMRSAE